MSELRETLARIDERTKNMEERLDTFVTRHEFEPVKNLSYGLVGLVLLAVVGAGLALILR